MFKRFLLLCSALLLAIMLPLSAMGSEAGQNDLLATIKERGYITIATEGDWSPWTYINEQNDLVGFDVEVGTEIAAALGVEAKFVTTQWDSILEGVNSGRFDLACNGVSYTEERAKVYDFSTPYAYTPCVLVIRSDNEAIKSFEDLEGKTTANTISSIYAQMAEEYGATVSGVDTLQDTIQLVLQGRADATINAEVSIQDYLSAHPDANIKIIAKNEGDTMVIPVRKSPETASLLEAVNAALEAMRENGRLAELSVKYFGADLTQAPE